MVPEDERERKLLEDPDLRAGLAWGTPRSGHPEGAVREHVAQLLARIDPQDPMRADLRFLAIVHDAFKASVRPGERWSRENDHAVIARRFAERHTADERLLATIELHDEPYWLWRDAGNPDAGLERVLERIPDVELFARFVELDASSDGKDLSFLWWFRRRLAARGLLPAHDRLSTVGQDDGEETLYIKTFAVEPADQAAVAAAARELVDEQAERIRATGFVLASADGLRVLLVWRWNGDAGSHLLLDGDVMRAALERTPCSAPPRRWTRASTAGCAPPRPRADPRAYLPPPPAKRTRCGPSVKPCPKRSSPHRPGAARPYRSWPANCVSTPSAPSRPPALATRVPRSRRPT